MDVPHDLLGRVAAAATLLRDRGVGAAASGIVLGSGLGAFADRLDDAIRVPYGEIPHWPASAVVGHAGVLVAGGLAGRRVIVLSGRAHVYEGHPLDEVTFGMRVLGALGVPRVILTNAAGAINTGFATGALMIIDDHINLMGRNPLVGPHDPRLGPRFPDMTEVYSRRLRAVADEAAAARGLRVEHGVYVAVLGPSYETPAEIRAFRVLGADAVGMSTAPEAIVARHMGLDVLGISCITNPAAGVIDRPLEHAEVMAVAARVRGDFIALLEGVVERL
ncbi:MAG: purine-nucleoside phosphorylase [Vicinamibacterales bacterium]